METEPRWRFGVKLRFQNGSYVVTSASPHFSTQGLNTRSRREPLTWTTYLSSARHTSTLRHPLQPFGARCATPEAYGDMSSEAELASRNADAGLASGRQHRRALWFERNPLMVRYDWVFLIFVLM